MNHDLDLRHPLLTPLVAYLRTSKWGSIVRSAFCSVVGLLGLWIGPVAFAAEAAGSTGVIQGRIYNESSGNYLNNARVVVSGTALEASTDATGFFRLRQVPAGQVTVLVSYVGLGLQTAVVNVAAGDVITRDFTMKLGEGAGAATTEGVVDVEAVTVTTRQLSGQASALQEQKNAPNIKNVIAFDEFGEMGEGNAAEYLKFVPGLDISYSPQVPLYMSIRGMPASGTLVTIDGATAATTGPTVSRNFDFSTTGTANIDRIEVTKTPTPDLPANAVGGAINIITKSGFSQPKAKLRYNVFVTDDAVGGIDTYSPSLGTIVGADELTTRRPIQPAFNLSYIQPVNDKFAVAGTASYAARQMDWQYISQTWDRVRLVQTSNSVNALSVYRTNKAGSASVDWRITPDDLLTVSYQRNNQLSHIRTNTFSVTLGANTTGDSTFSQGAATGVGTVGRAYGHTTQDKNSDALSLRYKHHGRDWKIDGIINHSTASYEGIPTGGFLTVTNSSSLNGNLIIRLDRPTAIEDLRSPVYSATNRAGAAVDIFSANTVSMTAAARAFNLREHENSTAGLNFERELALSVPVTLKFGALVDRQERYSHADSLSWSFNPPTGAAGRLLSNYDAFNTEYSNRVLTVDAAGNPQRPIHLSPQKIYTNIFLPNPTWFTLNEASRHSNWVNSRIDLEETVSAGYVRGDVRLFNNRLWLIGGVRYERTDDEGAGPKDDISATYVKNPDGSFARTQAGALIPITTNALAQAQLRYTELGTKVKKNYDGFYPSVNASYELRDNLVLRAAYARTIGRPELPEIIPGSEVSTPDSTSPTINVNNTGLNPWTADNFDLTLEAYNVKGATASISLFQKDVTGFFADYSEVATQQRVEELGLVWQDYYNTYDLVTRRNGGSATVKGVELSYRQTLHFLPGWAKRFQVFANMTHMDASGPDAANFSYSPERLNYGIGYYGKKFSANLNVADGEPTRLASSATNATTPANTYTYKQEYPRVDFSAEYNFTRRLGVYTSIRNLTGEPQREMQYNDSTPDYARPQRYLYSGAQISLGIKGEW